VRHGTGDPAAARRFTLPSLPRPAASDGGEAVIMTYIALNQAALIKMVERVDWKDAISGGSTLGAQVPQIVAFDRTNHYALLIKLMH